MLDADRPSIQIVLKLALPAGLRFFFSPLKRAADMKYGLIKRLMYDELGKEGDE